MKTIKYFVNSVMMLAVLSLAICGCSDPDGLWDPMEWKAEVPMQIKNRVVNVPETGAELIFSCRNYSSPWIEVAEYNGERYAPNSGMYPALPDWFKAEMNGNKLTVLFEPNNTGEQRYIQLTVTAGDIFYTFKFKQSAIR